MARNGSGTMSIVNSFSPSTTISSSQVNANFTDIASEITNSLAVDGQSTMTGAVKAANGAAATPSYTFGSDTNTGFFRKAADTIGIATAGAEVGSIDGSGNVIFSGTATSSAGLLGFAAGTKILCFNATAPTGWTIDTSVNDYAIRVVSSGAGATGGTGDFSTIFAARTIAANNLPNMTLTVTDLGHLHAVYGRNTGSVEYMDGGAYGVASDTNAYVNSSTVTTGVSVAIDNTSRGGVAQQTMSFAVKYVDASIITKS